MQDSAGTQLLYPTLPNPASTSLTSTSTIAPEYANDELSRMQKNAGQRFRDRTRRGMDQEEIYSTLERDYRRYRSRRSPSPDAVIAANAELMASNRRECRHAEEARTLADTHARHEREESQVCTTTRTVANKGY